MQFDRAALRCAALRCTVGFGHGGVACKRLAAIPPRDTELTSSSEFSADVGTDDALLPRRVCCAPIACRIMYAGRRALHVARCELHVVRRTLQMYMRVRAHTITQPILRVARPCHARAMLSVAKSLTPPAETA